MWHIYNTWNPKDVEKEKLLKLAAEIDFRPDILERTIALYDTIYQIMKADVKQTFIGGAMINQVYIDPMEARLSIDIDTVVREEISNKRDLLEVLVDLREKMLSDGSLLTVSIKDAELGIGEIISDTKRQALHPQVLFLKRIVPTLLIGTPLPAYLTKIGLSSKDSQVSRFLIQLKKEFGFLPRLYELRLEIKFSEEGIHYSFKKGRIFPYFRQFLNPAKIVECDIEEVQSAARGKLEFLELVDETETINITNTICDLRIIQLFNLDIDISPSIQKKLKRTKNQCENEFSKYWFYKLISRKYSFNELLALLLQQPR
ncbi:MAG: hypothetical protein ACTSRL_12865 [Candidatus Helarchaeota archaeon]